MRFAMHVSILIAINSALRLEMAKCYNALMPYTVKPLLKTTS